MECAAVPVRTCPEFIEGLASRGGGWLSFGSRRAPFLSRLNFGLVGFGGVFPLCGGLFGLLPQFLRGGQDIQLVLLRDGPTSGLRLGYLFAIGIGTLFLNGPGVGLQSGDKVLLYDANLGIKLRMDSHNRAT